MTTAKIAVSMPREVLKSAKRAVRAGHAPTLSAYVSEAVRQKTELDDLAELLDEMLAETGGPLTAAEKRRADAALGLRPRKTRSRR
ncbi:MAG: toxin-antitoxin system antitoxin subunit [Polyangiaceae bacterium]